MAVQILPPHPELDSKFQSGHPHPPTIKNTLIFLKDEEFSKSKVIYDETVVGTVTAVTIIIRSGQKLSIYLVIFSNIDSLRERKVLMSFTFKDQASDFCR